MAIKGCKSIAEYAIRRWLESNNFAMQYFELEMSGNEGTVTDRAGETMVLVYDSETKSVYIKQEV